MKSERREETITRIYWSCRHEEHRHRVERAAQRCIDKPAPKPRKGNSWTGESVREVARRRHAGAMLKTLAEEFNVTPGRMRQVVQKGERLLRYDAHKAATGGRKLCPE
jgi:hypothetical protein